MSLSFMFKASLLKFSLEAVQMLRWGVGRWHILSTLEDICQKASFGLCYERGLPGRETFVIRNY